MREKKKKGKEVCNGHVTVARGRGGEGVANSHMTVGGQGGRGGGGGGGGGGGEEERGARQGQGGPATLGPSGPPLWACHSVPVGPAILGLSGLSPLGPLGWLRALKKLNFRPGPTC